MNEYLRLHRQMDRLLVREGGSQTAYNVLGLLWAMGKARGPAEKNIGKVLLLNAISKLEAERAQPSHVA